MSITAQQNADKTIDVKEIAVKYNMGVNFFRTILCRSEFNCLQRVKTIGKARTKCNYKDCSELYKKINNVMKLKNKKITHMGYLTK